MTHRTPSRAAVRLLAAALVITPMLAACAGGGVKNDTRYVARDVLMCSNIRSQLPCSTKSSVNTPIRPGRAARS